MRQMDRRARRSSKKGKKEKKSRIGLWTALLLVLLIGAYIGVLELSRPHVGGDELRLDQFAKQLRMGEILDAKILDEDAYIVGRYRRGDGVTASYNAPVLRGAQTSIAEQLLRAGVPITVDQQVGKRVAALASILLPGLIIAVLFVYMIISYRRGSGLFAVKSGARKIRPEEANVTFADVAGQDAAVTELREVKEFLSNPDRFISIGAKVPKGILLYGPPGCGKTLLARALAGEAGASFYSVSGSDFVELYVGVGASRVRDLFKEARENAPAIIFIDELDSIGRARGASGTGAAHGEQEQALNQVLAEMDGFSPAEGIIVLGATNRPDVLDQALLRPGRFDSTIGLERPDEAARLAILEVHAEGKRLEPAVDLAAVASRSIGLTGADLAGVMNEAALLATRAGKDAVSQLELEIAVQRMLEAPERQRRLSLRERSIGRRSMTDERVTFADVAGVDDAIEELAEVRDYLADPERFSALGARVPRGILLSGPPGCGKTLLGRAVAGEANAAFFSVAASEFVEVFVGEGASRVRDLFAEARAVAPAIVFIDEIDAIGARRGASADGHREREQTLNQILVELDGFASRTGVIVMAATNRPDILDSALIRPGRFDRQVEVSLPDRAGRRAILELHARQKPLAADVDMAMVAGLTRGFSGADLANVLNEAALLAGRKGLSSVPMVVVDEAVDRAILGIGSRAHVMSEVERRIVAYHEAGHALVALALPNATPPHKLTVVPRSRSLGHCTQLDAEDRVIETRSRLQDRMAVLLGGWAAEELVFGEPSTGVGDDLKRAGEMARHMVATYGMSPTLGTRSVAMDSPAAPGAADAVAEAASLMLDDAQARARSVLAMGRDRLDAVAQALLERETLNAEELQELARPARP